MKNGLVCLLWQRRARAAGRMAASRSQLDTSRQYMLMLNWKKETTEQSLSPYRFHRVGRAGSGQCWQIWNNVVRILILPFKPGQLNNWQILSVHNGTTSRLKNFIYRLLVKKVRSGSGTVQLFRIRSWPSQKAPIRTRINNTGSGKTKKGGDFMF